MLRSFLPGDRLEVRIAEAGGGRSVALAGFGAWREKLSRFREVEGFLASNRWEMAYCTDVKGDASVRRYARLSSALGEAMLMDWPPLPDGPPIRDGRAYSEIAHLARDGQPYIAVSDWLRRRTGMSAPAVVAADRPRGLYLVEDLGDAVFGHLIAAGRDLTPLYALAVDGLLALRASAPPQSLPAADGAFYRVPEFDREAFEIEIDLLLEWYVKLSGMPSGAREKSDSFFAAWAPFFDWLDGQPKSLVLRDYHSPNLMLCDNRAGLRRLGVLDFQDALWGHPAYDLVSLLQDARLDVPEESERVLFERYCKGAAASDPGFDREAFTRAYAILGAQRNTKILGIFARLSLRDGKPAYLAHLPRITRYLSRNLRHPDLKPLKAWYEDALDSALVEGGSSVACA
jgi:aminoglycoside/choline kinase family phosphotransferase